MKYSVIAESYEKIEATTKRLEMTDYLVELLKETPNDIIDKVVYLTQGKLYPDFAGIEIGVAEKLAIRAVAKATGYTENQIEDEESAIPYFFGSHFYNSRLLLSFCGVLFFSRHSGNHRKGSLWGEECNPL